MHHTKKLILLFAFILVATYAQDDWVLTWSDEFDGPDVNTSNWGFESGTGKDGWGNQELQYYTNSSDNVFIQDGKLVIQAQKQDIESSQYTSARLTSKDKFSTTYGRFEVSAKLPTGAGLWPAFWLLGANIDQVDWPACGEIDILEWVGNDPNNIHGSTHGTGFDTSTPMGGSGWDQDFHTYGVIWQPDNIQFYFDNNTYATVTPDNTNGQPFVFNDNPMFMILNIAVGGKWPGPPDDSTQFPQQFAIDYVRVYEKPESSGLAIQPQQAENVGTNTANVAAEKVGNFRRLN